MVLLYSVLYGFGVGIIVVEGIVIGLIFGFMLMRILFDFFNVMSFLVVWCFGKLC